MAPSTKPGSVQYTTPVITSGAELCRAKIPRTQKQSILLKIDLSTQEKAKLSTGFLAGLN